MGVRVPEILNTGDDSFLSDADLGGEGLEECPGAGNLDIGRPDNMEIIFNQQVRSVAEGVIRAVVDRDHDVVVPPGTPRRTDGQGP